MQHELQVSFYLLFVTGLRFVMGHSWIDNLSEVSNVSNVGYIRDYEGHVDATSSFLIQSNASTQSLCKSNEMEETYTSQYPMLVIQAGSEFVANYTENGHVTKDALAPDGLPHPGNYTWYIAPNNESLSSPLMTMGDALGARVLGTGDFDDGKCAEDATKGRAGPRNCQSVVMVPEDLQPGSYQVVWLWNFPKVPGVIEMYSSCMDLQVQNQTDSSTLDTVVEEQAVVPSFTRTSTITQTISIMTTVSASNVTNGTRTRSFQSAVTGNGSRTLVTTTVGATGTLIAPGIYTTWVPITLAPKPQQINPIVDANNAPLAGSGTTTYSIKTVTRTISVTALFT